MERSAFQKQRAFSHGRELEVEWALVPAYLISHQLHEPLASCVHTISTHAIQSGINNIFV